jgi:hypothetical protein
MHPETPAHEGNMNEPRLERAILEGWGKRLEQEKQRLTSSATLGIGVTQMHQASHAHAKPLR